MRGLGLGFALGSVAAGLTVWFIQQSRMRAVVEQTAKYVCLQPTAACPLFGFPLPGQPGS